MASTKLTRTNGTSTNLKKWTWSAWIKRGLVGTQETFVVTRYDDNNYSRIRTDPDVLQFEDRFSSNTVTDIKSTEMLRDPSAWYHVVVRIDYTQSNAADRARMYVNGTEVTYATTTRQSQNGNSYFNDSTNHALGHYNNNNYFNGCMSHVHFTDGYSYGPDTFGSTDATTGQWKINTSPSVTYGNNGYFVLKDANGVTDQSGNSNNFTVGGGTLTQTEDNPSNVFATMSPIDKSGLSAGYSTLTNGNTRQDTVSASQNSGSRSTLAVNSGKWYVEAKAFGSASPEFRRIGILGMDSSTWITATNSALTSHAEGYAYKSDGNKGNNGSEVSYANSYTNGDIIGIAFDADNGTIWFSKNGTWQNSATITEIQNGTTTNSAYSSIPMTRFYGFAATLAGATSNMGFEWNFGNGFFGTTAISSEGTNASNIGKFEYDVPTGYTALSTKGLNE